MNTKRGFTLIELLVVIAIIGILSSVVLASLNSAREKSRDARRVGDIKQLQLALEMYYDSNNGYPTTAEGIDALVSGGFIPVKPTDPQDGSDYTYAASTTTNYVLRATLETDHSALDSDVDGSSVIGIDCRDTGGADDYYYCVQP